VIAFNKVDAVSEEELARKLAEFKRRIRKTPITMSGATGKSVDEVMKKLLKVISDTRRGEKSETSDNIKVENWQP